MLTLAHKNPPSSRTFVLVLILILINAAAFSQPGNSKDDLNVIDQEPFADAAHHWYDITDKGTVVHPVPNQPRYKNTELKEVGDNIILYQKNNGGWPKNYDIMAVLTQQQKDSLIRAKNILNTTFDNGTSYTHVAALAKIYTVTHVEKYKESALKGLDFILAAQYNNGGWPQYYPLEDNYSRYITFNDGAMIGIMEVLKAIVERQQQYAFVDNNYLERVKKAYEDGLDCIIKTQI